MTDLTDPTLIECEELLYKAIALLECEPRWNDGAYQSHARDLNVYSIKLAIHNLRFLQYTDPQAIADYMAQQPEYGARDGESEEAQAGGPDSDRS